MPIYSIVCIVFNQKYINFCESPAFIKESPYLLVTFCFKTTVIDTTKNTMTMKPMQPPTIAMICMSLVSVWSVSDIVQ